MNIRRDVVGDEKTDVMRRVDKRRGATEEEVKGREQVRTMLPALERG